MGIDYNKRPSQPAAPQQPPTQQAPAQPGISLQKVTLTKSAPSVSLAKQGSAVGQLRVNLNWTSGAKKGGFAHDTGEGSISQHHRVHGGDLIWEIGSGYFGCRNPDGTFSEERFAANATDPQVKMIELKLSQGAKPGHGGVLPGAKVTAEIAAARGVKEGEACISPASHSAFSNPVEMMQFIARLRTLSDMSSDVFWEVDADFHYSALSGLRANELLARRVMVLGVCPWDNPGIKGEPLEWGRLRNALESHQPFRDLQFQLQLPDGGVIHLQVSGDPVFGHDGSFCGFRGTGKDISKQKAVEAEIRRLNQSLEQRVAERTTELRQTNERLAHALEHLVQAEKLASLGNLVAGVAHELNTPLGNTLLTATHLRNRVQELQGVFASGAVRRSELTAFIELSSDGLDLIERNLNRAAALLANFKQVAVDQTSAQRRRFDLRKTVDEVVATLMPGLRKRRLVLGVEIPEGLELDSFPGPLEQVIANIVTNAAIHAFGPDEAGELSIVAEPAGAGEIELCIRDNGCGIPPEVLGRVFDPFFTTRMGQGGSGLGLYIVYNIVTSLLGGGIEVSSTPGGTCFTIRFPACAPDTPEGLASVLSVAPAPPPSGRA